MDIKGAFLDGLLKEEVYVENQLHEDQVYCLNKSLYGLEQAPKDWY